MLELFQTALAQDGLIWICLAGFVAGLVRGFSGFGTAMVFLPVAAQFLGPVNAILCLMAMDVIGPLPNLPGAWRDSKRNELYKLLIATLVVLPFATILLTSMSPEFFRYTVSTVALTLLLLLMLGVRYRGEFRSWMLYGAGGLGGFLGGISGVPGPPVIMIYMASENRPSVIRANNMLYLFGFDLLMVFVFLVRGLLTIPPLIIGLVAAVPYLLGNIVGKKIFNPEKEKIYRTVAYLIIAISAIRGLPIWG